MKLPRWCGHVLLWIGFLGGALLAVRNSEIPGRPWATISWPAYLLALAVAMSGVVILRATRRSARADSEKSTGDVAEMAAILLRLRAQLQRWQTADDRLPVYEFHGQIDERLSDDLARFAELRESLIDALGLADFAAVMTEFALAERTINRLWSASADGYLDEVDACLLRAEAHLDLAISQLDAARARSSTLAERETAVG
jgi:hypothetical protein